MKLTFWGTRGSIPTPGPDTVRYGGNTTCLQLEDDDGEIIIIDAGSGIRGLGLELAKKMPLQCSIFITHTHWDHIQGLPFFVPLFVPGNEISIYGTPDPVSLKTIKDALSVQMEYRYFPVREVELKSDINYETLREGQKVDVGNSTLTTIFMNHPVLTFGYKVEHGGRTFFFTGDHEKYQNIYAPGDDDYEEYEQLVQEKHQNIVNFIKGVDVMVADSQYTTDEYATKVGWGHSTFDMCVDLAKDAGVPRLYLTHHEPTRPDDTLEAIYLDLRERRGGEGVELFLATEGETIDI